ncbi:probable peptidoglycan muropeptide transporter SLC46 isoform X1 [Leptinotarsa decemlineata]|uniref:probable peptidoglycan muropeptide transporter SLC46 isoform X1 n=1 Tax=Leptinotarsa decemlineata TaxID=7539 RepID=UPI003D3081EC
MAWFKKLSVEVPVLLTFFGMSLTGSLSANLLIYRTCYILLGYGESNCSLLGNTDNNITQALEKLVEPTAQTVGTVQSTVLSVPMILLCICLGPWSDKFGRKPILLLFQLGSLCGFLIMALFSAIPTVSPWYFSISGIPSVITGGLPAFLTVALSHLTETSTQETRGMRMAIFEVFMAFGTVTGNLAGSALFYVTNYETVFVTAAVCHAIGFIYTFYCIPESVENVETEYQPLALATTSKFQQYEACNNVMSKGKLKGLLQTKNLKEMVEVAIKSRENFNTPKILMMASTSTVMVFCLYGEGSLMFPYLRKKLHWTLTMYNIYGSVSTVIGVFSILFLIGILHKWMKIRESILILIGTSSRLTGSVVDALATESIHIYVGAFAKSINGVTSPMVRTLISKLVEREEVGKIFSIMMISEFLMGLFASPLYTYIFNITINTKPGLFYLVSAGFYTFSIFMIGIVMILEFKSSTNVYNELENEPESQVENLIAASA